MEWFAKAMPPSGDETAWLALLWLAGVLEGEGTFLKPIPSSPRRPIVSCRMTDFDVVNLVAKGFGMSVQANAKGHHRTEFATCLRGSRAAELMRTLRPVMSRRRQQAIDRALRNYRAPIRKLNFEIAEEIRRRAADGETISSLARSHNVSRPTVRAVLNGRFYSEPKDGSPWMRLFPHLSDATAAGTGLERNELYWLAGWLEGEGSFTRPPPSSPRRPRIQATCSDQDVICEVSRLLRVTAQFQRIRKPNRSQLWRVLLAGGRAITLMQALRPLMGARRQCQIDAAIEAALRAGATPPDGMRRPLTA